MSEEARLKFSCLELAGGDVQKAQEMFNWLNVDTDDELTTSFEQWASGDRSRPPEYDSPIYDVFDAGIDYAINSLSALLDVKRYTSCDGTETLSGDVSGTLANILIAAGYRTEDGDLAKPHEIAQTAASPPLDPTLPKEGERGEQASTSDHAAHRDGLEVSTSPGEDEESRDISPNDKEAPQPEIPEGFTAWSGGECPVPQALVTVQFRDGYFSVSSNVADHLRWKQEGIPSDIVAYCVDKPAPHPGWLLHEGFTLWPGSECPFPIGTELEVAMRGEPFSRPYTVSEHSANEWQRDGCSGDIVAYRIVEAPADQLRTTEQDAPQETIEQSPQTSNAFSEKHLEECE